MFNKIYSKTIKFIKENLFFILLPIITITTLNIPLPYYIDAPGGIISLEDKVKVINGYEQKGSLNITYVSVYDGNVGTYIMSKFNKTWDLVPSKNVEVGKENRKDVNIRNKILLENSLSNAYYVAYKNLNKEIDVKNCNIYALYIDENATTNIETGDIIIKIDDIKINSTDDILNYLNDKNIGDKLKVTVNDGEEKYIVVGTLDGKKSLLISVICNYDYKDNVVFNFKNSESGPSGGLMIALSIYNQNISNDITKGKKIAGTGTIDMEGNVGEIGGVKYKIAGAVKDNVDVFFVPLDNYKEASKVVKDNNYKINIIPVSTFSDAVKYLNEN